MSAEWGFIEITEMVTACESAASIGKTRFNWADWEDMFHDAMAFLATHPEWQAQWFDGRWTSPQAMGRNLYEGAIYKQMKRREDRDNQTVPWDTLEEVGRDW